MYMCTAIYMGVSLLQVESKHSTNSLETSLDTLSNSPELPFVVVSVNLTEYLKRSKTVRPQRISKYERYHSIEQAGLFCEVKAAHLLVGEVVYNPNESSAYHTKVLLS